MNCVSCAIYACTTLGLFVFFPWGIPQLQSDCGACPVATDLIMRVNVRITTSTIGSILILLKNAVVVCSQPKRSKSLLKQGRRLPSLITGDIYIYILFFYFFTLI